MRRLPQTRQRCARSPAWSRIWRTAGADGSEQGSLRRGGRAAVYRPICVRCASRNSGRCDAHGRRIMTGLLALSLPILASAGRAGAPFRSVFRFAAVTAFVGYSLALWQMSIWYRRAWLTTTKATVDGVIYAVLTAATLGWLWPH